MSQPILVTYATRYGSTREVAERVAQTLKGQGLTVDTKPAGEVSSLDGYGAVVLGAPYYIGKLLKEATAFLGRYEQQLRKMPVALFTLGPTSEDDDMDEAREQMDATFAKTEWFKPVKAEMFVGSYDPAKLRGLDKLVTKPKASPLYGMPARDERDWEAISSWAQTLPEALGVG